MLAKKKILCYTIGIERKREKYMKKTNQKTEISAPEQVSKLQPFPFIEGEDYLLKLKNGNCVVAYWNNGQFFAGYSDDYVGGEIVGIVALKDLGL